MMHKCVMIKIGEPKNVHLAKKVNFAEMGEMYKYGGNRRKFINFVEIGGNNYVSMA